MESTGDNSQSFELSKLFRKNLRASRKRWTTITKPRAFLLREITKAFRLSVGSGHLVLLEGSWYITHSGLLEIARREHCEGIDVVPLQTLCEPASSRWVFKAKVYKSGTCRGFVGFGDADPSNVLPIVRGAELRIAETRAVNRALRKAYGIGLCSIEEIGSTPGPSGPSAQQQRQAVRPTLVAANGNGHHLRDRLLVLIRQHKLNGTLVKAYAADFCDVKELREASKEQVEQFIDHLSEYATNDRDGLLCQLNSYAHKQESAA
jgi:hypothetical protein